MRDNGTPYDDLAGMAVRAVLDRFLSQRRHRSVEPGVGSAPLKPSDEFVTALKILASRRGFRYGLFFPVWADVAEFIPCKRELIPCSDS